MGLRSIFLAIALLPTLACAEAIPEDQITQRIHSHLIIRDGLSAREEALIGLQKYPNSKLLWQGYIRALAKNGDEKAMMLCWRHFIKRFPEESQNHEILENLAWAVIEKGAKSSSPIVRATALLGACFSQDAKGVVILRKGLSDGNSFLRAAAVKLSSLLLDASLQEGILDLFKTEKVWSVRLEAIKALGEFQREDSRDLLLKIISQEQCHSEEKAAAIESLVAIADGIESEHIEHLVQNGKAGMRQLACKFIAHFEKKDDINLLFPILHDPSRDVRAEIFQTLGRLRVSTFGNYSVIELCKQAVTDPDPLVAITAAWTLTLNDSKKGQEAFELLLNHHTPEVRCLAAAALAATGKYGAPLALQAFKVNPDSFVRMNLALGLIGQRTHIQEACDCLFQGLSKQKEQWEFREVGSFSPLVSSKVKHDDSIPNYPEAVNQLARLEILEKLAIVHYPGTQQALKSFLMECNWGINGLASALLLTEGDEEAVDLVTALLKDPEQKVRIQAAIILALWSNAEETVQILQEAYPSAERELKGQILESLGRVGSPSSLVFLADKLQEPYQTLRIIAAAALLECLYH